MNLQKTLSTTGLEAPSFTLDALRGSEALRCRCCPLGPELVALMADRDQRKVQQAEQIRQLIEAENRHSITLNK